MFLTAVRVLYLIIAAGVCSTYVYSASAPDEIPEFTPLFIRDNPLASFVGLLAITQLATVIDLLMRRKRLEIISAVYFGLLVGWLLHILLNQALLPVVEGTNFKVLTQSMTGLIIPYLCMTWLLQTRNDFRFVIPYVEFSRKVKGGQPFVLDTSAIIDGRIADVIETHIFDADMIVPSFVLKELQNIADSRDKLRRNRGRRGLDILSKLQANENIDVKMQDSDDEEMKNLSVDQRLVAVAQQLGGRIITNDFNLNKVASVQGVEVVNLNDVANALKPRYLPGEKMIVKIVKEGEGPGQGIGYLEDGTMVVCEQASELVGNDTEMAVTSVLQNSAGRMIFGKLWESEDR